LGAGIRLGWMASAAPLIDRVLRLKPDGGTSPFASAIAARFMQDHMETQIARVRAFYRDKRDLTMRALDRHLRGRATWRTPEGGFFVWITFDPSWDVPAIVSECAARGVRVRSGSDFRVDQDPRHSVRLAFSHAEPQAIEQGVAVLGEVVVEQPLTPALSRKGTLE